MSTNTQILAIVSSIAIFVVVIDLVRRRKLKEEYSILWIGVSVVLLTLALWYGLLLEITQLVGAVLPSSTLFFFGLAFAMLVLLHFSVRISALERRVTLLVQELGLLSVDPAEAPLPPDLTAGTR